MINWQDIDTVMLDMDGTLLDLHFDNYFWTQHLPLRYSEIHGTPLDSTRDSLIAQITAKQGTLNWYCLDYWSEELKLDIPSLKREVHHLIAIRPYVEEFLQWLSDSHREVWLVTNAHQHSLDIKMERTSLDRWIDMIVISHQFSAAKEDPQFWLKLSEEARFDEKRTLLVDDNASVLQAAADFGIAHLLTLRQPDSKQAIRDNLAFPAIHHFDELLPAP